MEKEEERLLCSHCPFDRQCEGIKSVKPVFIGLEDGEEISLDCCPRHYLKQGLPVLGDPFFWFQKLESGILPLAGGYLDQSNIFVETMTIINILVGASKREWRIRQENMQQNFATNYK